MVPPTSVAVPEIVGVKILWGSGDKAVTEIVGFAESILVRVTVTC